jgi:signal peptidase I
MWVELILIVVIAMSLAAVTKAFVVQSFFVPSGSMEPTLFGSSLTGGVDDRILVEKVSYWSGGVHRGDVVVFEDSQGWLPEVAADASGPIQVTLEAVGLWPTGGHLVKRVIGLPGDDVVCCDGNGRVTVNGVALDETDYLAKGTQPSELSFEVTVPDGKLWVMGDNRQHSEDSRYHMDEPGRGFVPVDDVVGKVWAIVWPAGRAGLVHRPATFDAQELDG